MRATLAFVAGMFGVGTAAATDGSTSSLESIISELASALFNALPEEVVTWLINNLPSEILNQLLPIITG